MNQAPAAGVAPSASTVKVKTEQRSARSVERSPSIARSLAPSPAPHETPSSLKHSSTRFSVDNTTRLASNANLVSESPTPRVAAAAVLAAGAASTARGSKRPVRASALRSASARFKLMQDGLLGEQLLKTGAGEDSADMSELNPSASGFSVVGAARARSRVLQRSASAGRPRASRGRQIYLGVYNNEERAARAYDRAAIKFLGNNAHLNVRTSLLLCISYWLCLHWQCIQQ